MADEFTSQTVTYDFDRSVGLSITIPQMTGLGTDYGGSFLEMYKITDTLPFYYNNATADMHFSDMIWDFSPYKATNTPDAKLRLDFKKIPAQFVDITKFYALEELIKMRCKINSVQSRIFVSLKPFLLFADQHGCLSLSALSEALIVDYITLLKETKTEQQLIKLKSCIRDFIDFYSQYFEDISYILPKQIDERNYRLARVEKQENKIPDIAEEYFTPFINRILEIMSDETQTAFMRSTAAEIVILSQTGLRVSEGLMLRCDDLYEETFENGEKFPVLRYPTYKGIRAVPTYRHEYTYANEVTRIAIAVLKEIHKTSREQQKTDFLFAETWRHKAGSKGIDQTMFYSACERFFVAIDSEKFRTIDLPMEGNEALYRGMVYVGGKKRKLFYPRMHMLRVHMCTALRKNNVPRIIVQRMMSHLEAEMTDYYYRDDNPEESFQENYGFSDIVLEELQDKDIPLLGGDEENRKAIKDFIENGSVRVNGSPDEVLDALESDLTIRPKPFGMCITAPRHSCGKEIKANKLLCYNGQCGNDYHMYFNIAANWIQFQSRKRIIIESAKKGYITQAEQQIKYLVRLVNERMLDELKSLEDLRMTKGFNALALRHPELETVFDEYDILRYEVEEWKNMTLDLFLEQYSISH